MAARQITRRAFLTRSAVAGLGVGTLLTVGANTSSPVWARSAPAVPRRQSGKTITMGMWQLVPTLNTLMTPETGNVLSASRLVLRGLLFLDDQANPVGELAQEVPSAQNGGVSSDGKTITFK